MITPEFSSPEIKISQSPFEFLKTKLDAGEKYFKCKTPFSEKSHWLEKIGMPFEGRVNKLKKNLIKKMIESGINAQEAIEISVRGPNCRPTDNLILLPSGKTFYAKFNFMKMRYDVTAISEEDSKTINLWVKSNSYSSNEVSHQPDRKITAIEDNYQEVIRPKYLQIEKMIQLLKQRINKKNEIQNLLGNTGLAS